MIDFIELVSEMILLSEAVAVYDSISTTNTVLTYFYDNPSNSADLRLFLQTKFNISTWPDKDQLFIIVKESGTRVNATPLLPFVAIFPLLDFLWFYAESSNATPGDPIDNISKNFIKKCEHNNSITPAHPLFGYTAVSAKAISYLGVLQRKISSNIIGQVSLQNCDAFSIKKAFYVLLEARKKARKATTTPSKVSDSNRFVDAILAEPKKYTGQIQIPGEMSTLYTGADGKTLVEIALAIDNFYKTEKGRMITLHSLGGVSVDDFKTTKEQFITNTSLDSSNNFIFTTTTTATPSVSSDIGPGGYIIRNIRNQDTPAARELIEELELFANYISEGEPSDKMSGAAQLAKGLMFGVQPR